MTYQPPASWQRIRTIDVHTAGEPLRIVIDGFPEPKGATILAKRRHAREHLDHLRRALMWEPRGHADMYGCVMTEPVTPDGDVGVLFLHNEGFSTMCGHGIIGLVVAGLECGFLAPASPPVVRIDTPAGRVTAKAEFEGARVARVTFTNVPSFVARRDAVEVPGVGNVRYTLAYGGAFYAFVDAAALGVSLEPASTGELVELGMRIKRVVTAVGDIVHPEGDEDLGFLYGTIFCEPRPDVHGRHVCIFAEGEVDRSPTGTGVSARAAILHADGELATGGDGVVIDSILGTPFSVRVVDEVEIGGRPAVVPEVGGTAHLTGRHEFWIDPGDPLRDGFLLR